MVYDLGQRPRPSAVIDPGTPRSAGSGRISLIPRVMVERSTPEPGAQYVMGDTETEMHQRRQ